MSGKMPFEGKKPPFLRVSEKFLVSEFSVKNKSDISEHKKKPRKPTFSGLFWRREQDLNLRRLLTSHAFQACALNRSTISPSVFLEVKKGLSHHFFLPAQIEYQKFANKSIDIANFNVFFVFCVLAKMHLMCFPMFCTGFSFTARTILTFIMQFGMNAQFAN